MSYTSRYQRIEDIKAKALKDEAAVPTHRTLGLKRYPISQEELEDSKQEVRAAARKAVQAELDSLEADIVEDRRKAIQALVAIEPRPTESDAIEAALLAKTENVARFKAELAYHVSNGTVKALPYVMANKSLDPKDTNDYLLQLVPDIEQKRKAVSEVEEQERQLAIFKIQQRAAEPNLTLHDHISLKMELQSLGVNPNVFDYTVGRL
jgi:hypothetical protein